MSIQKKNCSFFILFGFMVVRILFCGWFLVVKIPFFFLCWLVILVVGKWVRISSPFKKIYFLNNKNCQRPRVSLRSNKNGSAKLHPNEKFKLTQLSLAPLVNVTASHRGVTVQIDDKAVDTCEKNRSDQGAVGNTLKSHRTCLEVPKVL